MCSPFDPLACVSDVVNEVKDGITDIAKNLLDMALSGVVDQLHAGIKSLMTILAGWLLVPSTQLCAGADTAGTSWMIGCANSTSPAAQLRSWTLPITILVATLGLLWQAVTLTITRKGEPLLHAVRGLGTLALWSAVGIVGTQLVLRASDDYTVWILRTAIFGDAANPTEALGTALANLSPTESYNALVLLLVFAIPILFITVAQIILMIFREGSVVILAGLLQLAAAGSFTRLTSGWLSKTTGWMLALIAYKPIAASVYATAFALMGAQGLRNSIMGLAVLLLAIVALPATMKFFNWTTGSLSQASSTLGMLGTAAAAGMHAASSMRGVGGFQARDHANFMADHGPGSSQAFGATTTVSSSSPPQDAHPTGAAMDDSTGAGAASAASTMAATGVSGGASVAAQAGTTAADAGQSAMQDPRFHRDDPQGR